CVCRTTGSRDGGSTTPGRGLAKLGVSVPVLGRAARSARILAWAGCPERDRASRECPGPEIPHETQDLTLAASRAGSSPPGPRRADRVRANRPRWRRRTVAWRAVTKDLPGRGALA